ncbi:MAG: type III pantothenate kinase [Deltaproteobacteria bacterium]|nr:type III pantothenate kinase [Deltaproteobacteria bacterium]
MLLAVDIGNTNIVAGVFRDDGFERHWRVSTDKRRTADEYGIIFSGLFDAAGLKRTALKGAVVCSVVPQLNNVLKAALADYLGVTPLIIGSDVSAPIKVLTDNPSEVGADRLVNAVAAYAQYRKAVIIVDFGTAVTFDLVTAKGEYAGGAIAPGVALSAEALFMGTAKLPRIEVERPSRAIGRNTVEAMRSGLFFGFIGLVDGLIERFMKEAGADAEVIATGGMAGVVIGESKYIRKADEFLTLKGLKIIYEGNR